MPNHWHFVLCPESDRDLARFMQRLTVIHVTRWQKHDNMVGYGHVYQSRFKSFPVETDEYFYQVNRDVERNALRAKLVSTAQDWKWGSLWIRQHRSAEHRAMLSKWPSPHPRKWLQYVNEPASEAELKALRRSCVRGTPYGSPDWVIETANQLGMESTLRLPGSQRNDKLDLSPFLGLLRSKLQIFNQLFHFLLASRVVKRSKNRRGMPRHQRFPAVVAIDEASSYFGNFPARSNN